MERERLRVILNSLIMANVALNTMPQQQHVQIIQSAVSQAVLPFGDYQDWRRIQDRVGAALSHNFAQPDPGTFIARSRAYWATFADSLLTDPSVEQPPIRSSVDKICATGWASSPGGSVEFIGSALPFARAYGS